MMAEDIWWDGYLYGGGFGAGLHGIYMVLGIWYVMRHLVWSSFVLFVVSSELPPDNTRSAVEVIYTMGL